MCAKDQFLFKLAVQIEIIELSLHEHPQDVTAIEFAKALRELHASLSKFPDGHVFFQQWAEPQSSAVSFSDMPPVEHAHDSCRAAALSAA